MAKQKCPECEGPMHKGFLLDKGYGTSFVPKWMAGEPEEHLSAESKATGVARHTVLAYRCERCGFLKFYAPSESA